jgi:hypothetical protein
MASDASGPLARITHAVVVVRPAAKAKDREISLKILTSMNTVNHLLEIYGFWEALIRRSPSDIRGERVVAKHALSRIVAVRAMEVQGEVTRVAGS